MKKCITCEITKPLDQFGRNKSKSDGLNPKCKPCYAEYMRGWYASNSDIHKDRVRKNNVKRRNDTRQKVWNYYKEHPCVDCGETDPLVLTFDHTRDKEFAIPRMVMAGYAWKTILKEIDKCEVRCANCHMRRSAEQLGWYKDTIR